MAVPALYPQVEPAQVVRDRIAAPLTESNRRRRVTTITASGASGELA